MTAASAVRTITVLTAALAVAVVPAGPAMAATWSVTPTPDPSSSYASRLTGVTALSASDAWAVGYAEYSSAPSTRPFTARWSAGAWSLVPSPVPAGGGQLSDVDAGPGGDGLWAVGSAGAGTLTQRWTGSAWTTMPSPNPAGTSAAILQGVKTFDAGSAWTVGRAAVSGGQPATRTLIERWDGANWSIVPSPNPDQGQNLLSAVDGAAANDVWAVGGMGFDGYGSETVSGLILHWNGTSWTQSTIPAHPTLRVSELRDVVAVAANDVWAVGVGFSWQLFSQVPAILHWNGQAWQHMAAPTPGTRYSSVTALSPTKVYAAGSAYSGTLVARWNGSTWTNESTPGPGGLMAIAAAADSGPVWAVGMSGQFRTLGIYTSNG